MSEDPSENSDPPKKKSCLATLIRWTGIAIVTVLLLFAVAVLVAMGIESRSMSSERADNPPMGQMVSVGDYDLHAIVEGEGAPTVVFEAGFANWAAGWALVYPEIAKRAKVVVYDRAGLGWSDPAPMPRTMPSVTADLHALLQAVEAEPPYVLVGHSMGGLIARAYQEEYPDEVAGLVLVDASHEDQNNRFPSEFAEAAAAAEAMFRVAPFLSRVGVMRMARDRGALDSQFAPYFELPSEAKSAAMMFAISPQQYTSAGGEMMLIDEAAPYVSIEPGSLGDLPVAVITAGLEEPMLPVEYADANSESRETWIALQTEQAQLSSNTNHTYADESGHMIPMFHPAAVIDGIVWVLDEIEGRE